MGNVGVYATRMAGGVHRANDGHQITKIPDDHCGCKPEKMRITTSAQMLARMIGTPILTGKISTKEMNAENVVA